VHATVGRARVALDRRLRAGTRPTTPEYGRMSDVGGEPACWAHLVDDLDTRHESDSRQEPARSVTSHGAADRSTYIDLAQLVDEGVVDDGAGAAWSLPHGGDLDANLIPLLPDGRIAEHVNAEVDVLVVVWDGGGRMTIDGRVLALSAGIVVLVPRDARRAIEAGPDGIRYLSIHRRRDGLTIRTR
jgi:quercetin dioxygenase-like cupin family protein